eukprot:TRINITY_DN7063_c0_g1_i8.p1 TRINITY_DN7063_c0_g1~~TRINITY_DN7063_c0_g1_i8.p1  ORF type:complete len:414 (-),score=6.79 TRINITY_DN7063_c0_g1_i8:47-1288(-)
MLQLLSFMTLIDGLAVTIDNDPTSVVGGCHDLTITLGIGNYFPENGQIIFIGLSSCRIGGICTDDVSATADNVSTKISFCGFSPDRLSIYTTTGRLSSGTSVKLTFKNIRYNNEKISQLLTINTNDGSNIIEEITNVAGWIPQNLAEIDGFGITSPVTLKTCESFTLTITGTPLIAIAQGSPIEITFDSNIDASSCTSSDLAIPQKDTNKIIGTAADGFAENSPLSITITNIIGPSTAKALSIKLITKSVSGSPVYENQGSLTVTPETVTIYSKIEFVSGGASNTVCEKGRYKLTIEKRCQTITNPKYVVVPPSSIFGTASESFTPNEDLDGVKTVSLDLPNPCSAVDVNAFQDEIFEITVYKGTTEVAFIYETTLTESVDYQPGELKSFTVTPSTPSSVSYTHLTLPTICSV